MRTLRAFTLPLDVATFRLPIPPGAELLAVHETLGLVAFALVEKGKEGESVFHSFRDGDEVPDHLEFVTSAQRANGSVVLIFRDRPRS